MTRIVKNPCILAKFPRVSGSNSLRRATLDLIIQRPFRSQPHPGLGHPLRLKLIVRNDNSNSTLFGVRLPHFADGNGGGPQVEAVDGTTKNLSTNRLCAQQDRGVTPDSALQPPAAGPISVLSDPPRVRYYRMNRYNRLVGRTYGHYPSSTGSDGIHGIVPD